MANPVSYVQTNYNKTFITDTTSIKGFLKRNSDTQLYSSSTDTFRISLNPNVKGFFTTYNNDESVASIFDATTITIIPPIESHIIIANSVKESIGELIITCTNENSASAPQTIYICFLIIPSSLLIQNDLYNLLTATASNVPKYMNVSTFLPTSDNGFFQDSTNGQVFLSPIPIIIGPSTYFNIGSFRKTNDMSILSTASFTSSNPVLVPPSYNYTTVTPTPNSRSSSKDDPNSVLNGNNTFICDTATDGDANSIYQTTTTYINQQSTNETLRALIFFIFFIITAIMCYAIVPILYQKSIFYFLNNTDMKNSSDSVIKTKQLSFVRGVDVIFSIIFIVLILILFPLGIFGDQLKNHEGMDLVKITIAGFSLLLVFIFSYIAIQLKKFDKNWPYGDMDFTDKTQLDLIPGIGKCMAEVFDRIQRKIANSN